MGPRLFITDIQYLAGVEAPSVTLRGAALAQLPVVEQAYLEVENDRIVGFGSMQSLVRNEQDHYYSAQGGSVIPCWCDSHTHLVFAAYREQEFVSKIKGLTYAEIAAAGGGILNSARRLGEMSESDLLDLAKERLFQCIRQGTGAIEIKSGYGLTVASELKMLRVIQQLKSISPIPIKSSFLGAHAYPTAYKENHTAYLKLMIDEMLPEIGRGQLADFIDVFCEEGFFSVEEMRQVVEAGQRYGLKPKLHVNQLHSLGAIQAAIELNALSVDHLEVMTEVDIKDLAASSTIGTLLPTAAYFLRMPFQPARKLIDAGAAIALASDFNPGSSPSGNMHTVLSMSCIQMRMLPEEAIQAATIQGAFAMELESDYGSLAPGKKANFILTRPIPSLAYLPYAFGDASIREVFINGQVFPH